MVYSRTDPICLAKKNISMVHWILLWAILPFTSSLKTMSLLIVRQHVILNRVLKQACPWFEMLSTGSHFFKLVVSDSGNLIPTVRVVWRHVVLSFTAVATLWPCLFLRSCRKHIWKKTNNAVSKQTPECQCFCFENKIKYFSDTLTR